MRRLRLSIAALFVTGLAGTGGATAAPPPVFSVVPSPQATIVLASAEVPNRPDSLVLPPAYLQPRQSTGLPFPALHGLWQRAGATYGIPWQVLAAINKIESNFGQNMGPSSAGALGWMQFMPSTWLRWGMDANGDRIADPWNPDDAIFAAARYLAAAGGRTDLSRGIFAYNHAQWYVDEVLALARVYGRSGVDISFSFDRIGVRVEDAEQGLARQKRILTRAAARERRLAGRTRRLFARTDATELLTDRLLLQKQAFQMDALRADASRSAAKAKKQLVTAERTLAAARSSSWTSAVTPLFPTLLGPPMFSGDYVFPVGGGASLITTGHTHHDYPAADIAAPVGAPLYALTNGFVIRGWPTASGRCGIGFTMQAAGDRREWTYCHLSYLEPGVRAGAALGAGTQVGLVGTTGHSSGPHLHLQLAPPVSYPQEEPWFRGFEGTAFRWNDTPVRMESPVFAVVDPGPSIGFTLGTR